MRDKKLESKIKRLNEFMQLWIKFHDMYKSALNRDTITPEEENSFLETKSLIARKYQALKEFLEIGPSCDDRTFDVISQLLSLKSVSTISDLSLHKIENDWHNSYIVLNKILGELEAKEDIAGGPGRILRDLTGSPIVNLAILIIVILAIFIVFTQIGRMRDAAEKGGKIEFKQNTNRTEPGDL